MDPFARLPTERPDPRFSRLDRLTAAGIARLMIDEERAVDRALRRAAPAVGRAAERIARALASGGRLLLVGAGTSGRLAVLEAAECVPTFGTPPPMVQGIIAGGSRALVRSIEGAEDDPAAGARALRRRGLRRADVVVGIAASGRTPFVVGALREARRAGAAAVLVTCAPGGPRADVVVRLPTGPEVVAGSTRLKAGTATKRVLNILTTAAMARIGKVYGNLMVDVRPNSRKLRARQERIVARLAGAAPARARSTLARAGRQVKTAVVMLRRGVGAAEARRMLARAGGRLRRIIG
jgi:N-acetylmuramic acid 6-phosphate etherase